MKGVDVNTESNRPKTPQDQTVSGGLGSIHRRHPRFMTVMLPALLVTYIALPLAVAHK